MELGLVRPKQRELERPRGTFTETEENGLGAMNENVGIEMLSDR